LIAVRGDDRPGMAGLELRLHRAAKLVERRSQRCPRPFRGQLGPELIAQRLAMNGPAGGKKRGKQRPRLGAGERSVGYGLAVTQHDQVPEAEDPDLGPRPRLEAPPRLAPRGADFRVAVAKQSV